MTTIRITKIVYTCEPIAYQVEVMNRYGIKQRVTVFSDETAAADDANKQSQFLDANGIRHNIERQESVIR